MARSTLPTFVSHNTRTRGGVGFYADPRDNNRLEEMGCAIPDTDTPLPGELRRFSKRFGRGQVWDLGRLAVRELCRECGEEALTNIVGLCPACAHNITREGQIQGPQLPEGTGDTDFDAIIAAFKAGEISQDEALQRAYEINDPAEKLEREISREFRAWNRRR